MGNTWNDVQMRSAMEKAFGQGLRRALIILKAGDYVKNGVSEVDNVEKHIQDETKRSPLILDGFTIEETEPFK